MRHVSRVQMLVMIWWRVSRYVKGSVGHIKLQTADDKRPSIFFFCELFKALSVTRLYSVEKWEYLWTMYFKGFFKRIVRDVIEALSDIFRRRLRKTAKASISIGGVPADIPTLVCVCVCFFLFSGRSKFFCEISRAWFRPSTCFISESGPYWTKFGRIFYGGGETIKITERI
jgi:hypothetical protein